MKVQRVKVQHGDDGTARDASSAYPLPASVPSATTTGTITAANTTPDAGTGTAGSSVVLTIPDGHASVSLQLSGTFSAGTTLAFQTSIDGGATWWYTNARRSANTLGVNETISMTSTDVVGGAAPTGGNPSFWRGTTGSSAMYRVTCISFTPGDSIAVRLLSSGGVGGTYQLGSLPAGTSTIGAFKKAPAATGTITSVTAAAASTLLLAANSGRLGATFFNDSSATLYLALAGSASTTAYTVQVPAGGYYELPNDGCGYVGAVYGIWSAANGAARVTELT